VKIPGEEESRRRDRETIDGMGCAAEGRHLASPQAAARGHDHRRAMTRKGTSERIENSSQNCERRQGN
jgi:hypothetical protein